MMDLLKLSFTDPVKHADSQGSALPWVETTMLKCGGMKTKQNPSK